MSKLQVSIYLICSGIFILLIGLPLVGLIVGFAGIISGFVCLIAPWFRETAARSKTKDDED